MSLPSDARDALASLASKFEAKAATYPDFKHILIEIPHQPPERRPTPINGSPIEQLRYQALVEASLVASCAGDRESAEEKLFAFARRLGVPEDQADAIIRSAFEEIEAHRQSPFSRGVSEARHAVNDVFGTTHRLFRQFMIPPNAIQVFIDDHGYETADKGYEAFWPLAERSVKILAAHGVFEPTETPPDPTEDGLFEGRKAHYAVQWLLFVHRHAKAHSGALPCSESAPCLEHFPLKEGGVVNALEPGVFEASSLTLRRILRESEDRTPSPAATTEGEDGAPRPAVTQPPAPSPAPTPRGDEQAAETASGIPKATKSKRTQKRRPARPKTLHELADAIRRDRPRQRNVPKFLDLIADENVVDFNDIRDKVHGAKVDDDAIKKTISNARAAIIEARLHITLIVSDRRVYKKQTSSRSIPRNIP
jgi:hypothetical protein